jgi:hypothetical protein
LRADGKHILPVWIIDEAQKDLNAQNSAHFVTSVTSFSPDSAIV